MKLRDPKLWIAVLSLILVGFVFYSEFGSRSPGPLSAVHHQESSLEGNSGCAHCHTEGKGTVWGACLECHKEVSAQIDEKRGFHGTLKNVNATACATCHGEHEGPKFNISGERAFLKAGVADVRKFDHAELKFSLAGKHTGLDCKACHKAAEVTVLAKGQPRFGGLRQNCESCHEDPHKGQMKKGCTECHGQSGTFKDMSLFVHSKDFPLVGSHGTPGCIDCHKKESEHAVEVLAGRKTAAPARTCVECHATPHSNGFVQKFAAASSKTPGDSCLVCHEPTLKTFAGKDAVMSAEQHASTGFPLVAPHLRQTCDDCHRKGISGATFKDRYPGRALESCESCHADAHLGEFTKNPAFASNKCIDCHNVHGFKPSNFDAAAHGKTAFALTGRHATVECAQCHKTAGLPAGTPPRFNEASGKCADCHKDAHGGSFARAPFVASGCEVCHTTTDFQHLASGAFDHAKWTAFPLVGAHAKANCAVCHATRAKADETGRAFGLVKEKFPRNDGTCQSCHRDPHDGKLNKPPINESDCASCHRQDSFKTVLANSFDHNRHTTYPLQGAHARAACESCHTPREKPDEAGRVFGRVADTHPGDLNRCETCHQDPHRGTFDAPGRPAVANGKNGCERCHTVESFAAPAEANATFDHNAWTRFPLEGRHAGAACNACHIPSPTDPARSTPLAARARAPIAGSECASCHADIHVGQFVKNNVNDCARCHDASPGFAATKFNHQRDSRFALDATHASVACAACHTPWSTSNGAKAVRYRPLASECVDCHKPPSGK